MATVRWDPFRDFMSLQDRMNRLFDERLRTGARSEESLTGTLVPPVDIYETEHAIVLEADLPGLDLNDLDLRVENNTLTVRGERKPSGDVREENYHRMERGYGVFTRTFALPNTVNPDNINAGYNNGVLQITLAKREETKPKQIRVQVQSGQGAINPAGEKSVGSGKTAKQVA